MPAVGQDHDVVIRQVVEQRAKIDAIDASRFLAERTALSMHRISIVRPLFRLLNALQEPEHCTTRSPSCHETGRFQEHLARE